MPWPDGGGEPGDFRADAPSIIDWKAEKPRLEAFMDRMPFRVRLNEQVSSLSAGEKQKLEILKLPLSGAALPDPRRAQSMMSVKYAR